MSMSLPQSTLLRFPNRVFVETGTNNGDGIALALNSGFSRVLSIELSDHYFSHAASRFADDDRVQIVHGDSGKVLADVIAEIDEPATFWLDGHYTPGLELTARCKCPLLSEIAAIETHSIKTHSILVDDVRCLGTPILDWISVDDVKAAILRVNPKYKFEFIGDVLTAVVTP